MCAIGLRTTATVILQISFICLVTNKVGGSIEPPTLVIMRIFSARLVCTDPIAFQASAFAEQSCIKFNCTKGAFYSYAFIVTVNCSTLLACKIHSGETVYFI